MWRSLCLQCLSQVHLVHCTRNKTTLLIWVHFFDMARSCMAGIPAAPGVAARCSATCLTWASDGNGAGCFPGLQRLRHTSCGTGHCMSLAKQPGCRLSGMSAWAVLRLRRSWRAWRSSWMRVTKAAGDRCTTNLSTHPSWALEIIIMLLEQRPLLFMARHCLRTLAVLSVVTKLSSCRVPRDLAAHAL
jgi:hypothetical protein